jgi:cysteine desulfurase
VRPVTLAGGQEHGLRGGTENVAGAHALATAAEEAFSHLHDNRLHMDGLASRMLGRIAAAFPGVERLGNPDHRLPHVLSVRIPGIVAHTLLLRCDARGLAFSTGSACHGEQQSKNHVHTAIGLKADESREVMRFSFSRLTTVEEVDRAAEIVVAEAEALAQIAPQTGAR